MRKVTSLVVLCLSVLLCRPAVAKEPVLMISQVLIANAYHSVLVVGEDDSSVEIVDLTRELQMPGIHPLALVSRAGYDVVAALGRESPTTLVPANTLTLEPILGSRHIAAATNYADHQEETSSDEVFLFPKLAPAMSGSPRVATVPGILLDYEIEICAVFDRDITGIPDFDSALKGFFLCGDFTDRAVLLRKLDPLDMALGAGFTEAKSGDDRFPVGNRLLVPRDWRSFIDDLPLQLQLNGVVKQQAVGADMLLKLDEIIALALSESGQDRWNFRNEPVSLVEQARIPAGQVVLTGTPGGVLMQIPPAGDLVRESLAWLFSAAWLEQSLQSWLVDRFVADAEADRSFLQPGDEITMSAGPLGELTVRIIAGE